MRSLALNNSLLTKYLLLSSSFIFYFVCQNHTKSRRNAYRCEFPQKSIFRWWSKGADLLPGSRRRRHFPVSCRGEDTGKSATSPTSPCLVAGIYGDFTGLSRTCHGEVGVMEFGLNQARHVARQKYWRHWCCITLACVILFYLFIASCCRSACCCDRNLCQKRYNLRQICSVIWLWYGVTCLRKFVGRS